jgi:ClpP class serine protease
MDKVGIESLTITQGKDKDALNPFRPWKQGEDQSLVNVTKCMYEQFVAAVVKGRPNLDADKLVKDYGAQIFIASEAEKLGYIDVTGADYSMAMKELATAASLQEPYQVVQLSKPQNILSQLAQSKLLTGKIEHVVQMGPYMSSELSGKLLFLYQPTH